MSEAGTLHDIGKIGVRDIVLHKPGPLTDEEYKEIQAHPEQGCRILLGLDFLEFAIPYVRHHHERWDGRGYPAGLVGPSTPIGARIMAVADSYDAMTSSRPYRDAMPAEKALAQIRLGSEAQFDPRVARAFLALAEAGMLVDEDVSVHVGHEEERGR